MTNTTTARRFRVVGIAVVACVVVAVVVWRASMSPPGTVDVVIHDCRTYRQAQDVRKLLESLVGEAQVQQVSVRKGEGLIRVTGEPALALAERLRGQRVRDQAVVVDDVTDSTISLTLERAP